MKVSNILWHKDKKYKMLGKKLPKHRKLISLNIMEKPGPIQLRLKNLSEFSEKLPNPKKLTDFKDI